ncbi:MAG: hypothetical protein MI749_10390 [Desulfovibrionales bacterium]|nr:hypothetical protein [Desulfovibrionales bacterium]
MQVSLVALPNVYKNVLARVIKSFEDSKGTFEKVPLAAGGNNASYVCPMK